MAFCRKCGAHVPDDARYCHGCGSEQPDSVEDSGRSSAGKAPTDSRHSLGLPGGIALALATMCAVWALLYPLAGRNETVQGYLLAAALQPLGWIAICVALFGLVRRGSNRATSGIILACVLVLLVGSVAVGADLVSRRPTPAVQAEPVSTSDTDLDWYETAPAPQPAVPQPATPLDADPPISAPPTPEPEYSGPKSVTCGTCGGSGDVNCDECGGTGISTCPLCDGAGSSMCYACDGTGQMNWSASNMPPTTCSSCGGSGSFSCQMCSGSGRWTCMSCAGTRTTFCPTCLGSGTVVQ